MKSFIKTFGKIFCGKILKNFWENVSELALLTRNASSNKIRFLTLDNQEVI